MSISSLIDVSSARPVPPSTFEGALTDGLSCQMDNPHAHVFIVDDSEEHRNIYAQYLTEKGYRISKAHGVEEALEKALEIQPDLVVLHLWLPKINGWELTRRLKSNQGTRRIPVLVLAGRELVPPRECEGVLRKPFPLDEFFEAVAHCVSALA